MPVHLLVEDGELLPYLIGVDRVCLVVTQVLHNLRLRDADAEAVASIQPVLERSQ